MAKLSYVALLGLLSCLVEGQSYIVGTTKPVEGSKAHRRALKARDGSLLDILNLADVLGSTGLDASNILYRYSNSATGFAAKMTPEQAEALAQQPNVLYVVRSQSRQIQTTRTPKFLGIDSVDGLLGRRDLSLSLGLESGGASADEYQAATAESDLIFAFLDTGIWPESESFNDDGFPPPPSHWKGQCTEGDKWTKDNCNNKLIGARYYYQGYLVDMNMTESTFNQTKSARDDDGHGTHTSSTAAGSVVQNVNLFGQMSGTARGMAPGARIAMYKVCWAYQDVGRCEDPDILAALDDAIEDGVNIISMSLGSRPDKPIISGSDTIWQGSFRARQQGIHVFQSAGNSGPDPFTHQGVPWLVNVGASTIDRTFPAPAVLSDGTNFTGISIPRTHELDPLYVPLEQGKLYDFVLGSEIGLASANVTDAQRCFNNTLDPTKAAGKIVVCQRGVSARVAKGAVCRDAGAAGMVLYNDPKDNLGLNADAHLLPATHITYPDGLKLVDLVKAGGLQGTIDLEGTVYGVPAPRAASFTSRGPNLVDVGIGKPDITGPGVSIIAAWSEDAPPSGQAIDTIRVKYNSLSGTSMSCPHMAGLAGWILARRPSWTPAMVQSAMMTTAYNTLKGSDTPLIDDATDGPADAFAYGNGHVDPVAALDPGLVYDVSLDDYYNYACGKNSSDAFIAALSSTNTQCDVSKAIKSEELNYPSFATYYDSGADTGTKEIDFPRTLTAVGGGGVYTAKLSAIDNPLVSVSVSPETLTFSADGDQQSYLVKVTLQPNSTAGPEDFNTAFGRLVWSDGVHMVSSSISFSWFNLTAVAEAVAAASG